MKEDFQQLLESIRDARQRLILELENHAYAEGYRVKCRYRVDLLNRWELDVLDWLASL